MPDVSWVGVASTQVLRFDALGLDAANVEVVGEVVVGVPVAVVARDGALVDPHRVLVPAREAEGLREGIELIGEPRGQ